MIRYNYTCFRDVAQVVERYFREVEVASSSLVIPISKNLINAGNSVYQAFSIPEAFITLYHVLLPFTILIVVQIVVQNAHT